MNTQNKKKKTVSNIMLVLIVVMIVLYTAATFVLQYFTQVEISPTLTTAWFTFWTVEIVALAAIKTSKVKHNKDVKQDTTNIDQPEEEIKDPEVFMDDETGLVFTEDV